MSNNPDDIRRDIERTRAALSDDVNTLADGANPGNAARRTVDSVKDSANDLKHRIFGDPNDPWDDGKAGDARYRAQGAVDDVRYAAADAVQGAKTAVQDAPGQVRRQAQGNPLAAGLIAFGVGALIGGLIPASRAEQDLASTAKDKAQPLVDEAKSMAQDAADNLKPAAQEAADSVKQQATSAADKVKGDAQQKADEVKGDAQQKADEAKQDDRNPL